MPWTGWRPLLRAEYLARDVSDLGDLGDLDDLGDRDGRTEGLERARRASRGSPGPSGFPGAVPPSRIVSEPTLFAPPIARPRTGATVSLDDDATGHSRALRLRHGDLVRVTDGHGGLWRARYESPEGGARVVIQEALEPPGELPVELAFGVAGKSRTLWLVEKCVELGVRVLQPVECERSRSVADAARSRGFWRKAGRRARSALTQCGGARLPELRDVCDLRDYLQASRETAEAGMSVCLDRAAGNPLRRRLQGWAGERPLRLLIGPEGGLTGVERDWCREAGFAGGALGARTLRFETAAVAALTVAAQQLAVAREGGER